MFRPGHPILGALVVLSACSTSSQSAPPECPQCPRCPEVAAATASAQTAPLEVSTSVPLDTPKAAGGAEEEGSLVLSIARDGKLFLGDRPMPDLSALRSALQEVAKKNADARLTIRADKDATHGMVIAAIDAAKQAGVTKVAFATTPPPPSKP